MAISYLGNKDTQDTFTLGSSASAVVNGQTGTENDIVRITKYQTATVNATSDDTQTLVFEAGIKLQSVQSNAFGTKVVFVNADNTTTTVQANASNTFQVGSESFTADEFVTWAAGKNIADGTEYEILGTEGAADFAISADVTAVNEGSTVTISIANAVAGEDYSYTLSGVAAADVAGDLTGTVRADKDGNGTLEITLSADATTEGAETLTVTINGQTVDVTVNDTSEDAPAPEDPAANAESLTIAATDAGKTMASLDDFGTTIDVNNFVQGTSTIDLKAIFTDLKNGFGGSDDADSVSANSVSYQRYGEDLLVYIERNGSGDITNANNITLRLKAPTDANGNALSSLNASDFIGLPISDLFSQELDYNTSLDATDNIVRENTGADINGLDLVDFGDGDDTLWLDDADSIVLQSGNITGLENVYVTHSADATETLEIHDDFLSANGNNINVDSSGVADASKLTLDTENVSGANTVTLTGTATATLADGGDNNNIVIADSNGANTTSDVVGGDQADTITAGDRADTIDGQDGDDVISAGAGKDLLTGGDGSDTLTGGEGQDDFIYIATSNSDGSTSTDVIKDFTWSVDKIDLSAAAISTNISNGFKTEGTDNSVWAKDDGDDVLIIVETGTGWAADGDEEMVIRLENPMKADGTPITAADINFLDFRGVSAFTQAQDEVIGRATDDSFTVSTASDLDLDGADSDDDTIDGGDGYDTLVFNADQSNGTRIFDGANVQSVEEIQITDANASTNLTIKDNFVTTSQGADGADAGGDDDVVKIVAKDANATTDITLDTSDLSTGEVALSSETANAIFNLADTAGGNKKITVATGATAAIALTDTDAAGIDEFTGGTGDDTVYAADGTLQGDVLNGGASNADETNGDTLDITTTGNVTADNLANVTNFENIQVDADGDTITFNDANVAAGEEVTVTATGTTGAVSFDATNETDGRFVFDLADANDQDTTVDVNVENYTGDNAGTAFSGDEGSTVVELDLHTDANATVTADDLENVTDLDTLKVTGNFNWDITLSGNEVDGDSNLTVDASAVTSGTVAIDATNEQAAFQITISGTIQAGDDIVYTVNGTDRSYVVTQADVDADDSHASVAQNLAAAIAADSTVSTYVNGEVITVAETDGTDSISLSEKTDDNNNAVLSAASDNALTLDASGTAGKVSLDVNQDHIATGLTATGGTGTDDTLTVHGEGDLALGANITAIENLELKATDTMTVTLHDANVAAGKTLAINAASVAAESGTIFTLNAQAELDGILNVTGGESYNTIQMTDTLLNAQVQTVTGGGRTTLEIFDAGVAGVTIAASQLANITKVTDIEAQDDQSFNITLNDATSEAGDVYMVDTTAVATAGNNVVVDASNETDNGVTITVSSNQFNDTNDVVTGGAATDDMLTFGTGTAVSVSEANAAGITAVETIKFSNLENGISFTTNDANVAAGKSITLNASNTLTAEQTVVLNASAESNGKVTAQVNAGVRDMALLTLSGTKDDGDVFTVTIGDDEFSYTVLNGDADMDAVATKLAALVDANNSYTAQAIGSQIIVEGGYTGTNLGAITVSATEVGGTDDQAIAKADIASVLAVGGTFEAGDVYSVDIDGTTYSHTVVGGDTNNAGIATALAAAIDAGDLSAFSDGTNVYIVGAAGSDNLVTNLTVTDFGAGTDDGTLTASSAAALADETLTGGQGTTDVLELSSNGSDIHVDAASAANITAFETVKFTSDVDVTFAHADATVGASDKVTYDARDLTADSSLDFDGTAETNGILNVFGGAGGDTIVAGDGADIIRGGKGADTVTGGNGADRFVFNTADFDGSADVITDFGTSDEIYLEINGAVDFNSDVMNWNSTGAFNTGSDWEDITQVRKVQADNGIDTLIQFDINGDGVSDQDITLTGIDATTVTTDSFVFG